MPFLHLVQRRVFQNVLDRVRQRRCDGTLIGQPYELRPSFPQHVAQTAFRRAAELSNLSVLSVQPELVSR